jgi:Na+/H+ antiporter NhaC
MKAELYSNISKYVLYAFAAIILVVFALFFFAGEPLILEQTSEAGEVTELPYPQFMEPSLYLCYAMCAIALMLVVVFEVVANVKRVTCRTRVEDAEEKANRTLELAKRIAFISLVVIAVVLYFVVSSKLDFVLYLQYALFAISAICMLGSFAISKLRS